MRTGEAPDVLGCAQAFAAPSLCASPCAAPPVAPPQLMRRPAPDRARDGLRRRWRLAGALGVSLIAHGALAALVWRAPAPAPAPGLVETYVVFAGEIPAAQTGAQTSVAPAPEPEQAAEGPSPSPPVVLARLDPAPDAEPDPPAAPAPQPVRDAAPSRSAPARSAPARSAPARSAPAPAARREPRAASAGAQQAAAAPPHYLTQVMARLQAAQRFPEQARARGEEGRAVVRFAVRRDGALGEARLAVSSGFAALDQAALDAVRRAAPFPPPPIAGGALTLTAPMRFRIE